jgi:pimeloyl-ACP methyl ester carboxylesterase
MNTLTTTPHVTKEEIEKDGGKAIFVNGRTIEYFISGKSNGIPLLWYHGAGSTGRTGKYVGKFAEDHNITVISITIPGWGGTSPIVGRGYIEGAIDALEVLKHLGIDKFHIQGVSYGSGTAAALAQLVPDRVKSLQLVVPAWPSMGTFHTGRDEGILASIIHGPNVGRVYSYYLSKIPMNLTEIMKQIAPKDIEEIERHHPEQLHLGEEDYRRSTRYHHEGNCEMLRLIRTRGNEIYDKINILRDLGSKVSVWYGLNDTITPSFGPKYILSILPDAKPFPYPLGHLGMLMDSTKYFKEILNNE